MVDPLEQEFASSARLLIVGRAWGGGELLAIYKIDQKNARNPTNLTVVSYNFGLFGNCARASAVYVG
jgi:hypothetical protein